MKRRIVFLMLVGLFTMLFISACSDGNLIAAQDKNLQLELVFSRSVYSSNEPIECKAILSYIGAEDSFDFYSGKPIVMFSIGGSQFFNGKTDLLQKGLYSFTIQKDAPLEYPFSKYKGTHLNTDKDAIDFWNKFLAKDELLLEPGDYKIFAQVSYALTPGDTSSTITVSKTITVK